MKPYIARLMKEAHEKGTPVMRPLFYDFPEDPRSWDQEDEYLFGPDVLVAPVMYAKRRAERCICPAGKPGLTSGLERALRAAGPSRCPRP